MRDYDIFCTPFREVPILLQHLIVVDVIPWTSATEKKSYDDDVDEEEGIHSAQDSLHSATVARCSLVCGAGRRGMVMSRTCPSRTHVDRCSVLGDDSALFALLRCALLHTRRQPFGVGLSEPCSRLRATTAHTGSGFSTVS